VAHQVVGLAVVVVVAAAVAAVVAVVAVAVAAAVLPLAFRNENLLNFQKLKS